MAVYQNWFSRHSSTLSLKQLPIPKQNNSSSCGILAKVALEGFISSHPPQSQDFDARAARLRTFIELVKFILERVSWEKAAR